MVIKQGDKIPYPDGYFDAILSTQVFEHIENVRLYADEIKRVLKDGGRAFISSAFAWDYHPYPKDYWRITEDGYRSLFKNFSDVKFSYDTNSFQTILQSVNLLMARRQVKIKLLYRIINYIVSRVDYEKGDNKIPGNIFLNLIK